MKTIELKHIAPYLPYGLECEILNFRSDYVGERYGKVIGYYMLIDRPHYVFKNGCAGKDSLLIRPFLRPLSDLTKPEFEFVKDEFSDFELFDLGDRIENSEIGLINREGVCNNLRFEVVSALFENHFDVYGLIESGLAIDINTLKNA